jgi:AP2-associated kinase
MNHQPNIYPPGTHLTVGSHQVVINNYFNKGGFAQVYTCRINPPWNNTQIACLKRVNVPDKASLGTLRKEVDAMRKLRGIDCIVSYIDSHAARSHNGKGSGYEVFVLMEYCSRKGLIDFMNTRLVNKLTEPEILVIMEQITEGVAHMHALNPPLIHRDIKIENVLIGDDGTYKLCDFGSVSTAILPPKNVEEFQIVQDDIMKNTTPQYRCPEMLDLYKRQPINEKSDIWALGVFLYKLCYYTTPFEANAINGNTAGYSGDYAIINGIYQFPSSPPYSARLKNIIAKLLVVDQNVRPNVFQLLEEICKMRGKPVPNIQRASTTTYSSVPLLKNPEKINAYSISANNSVLGFNNSVTGTISNSFTDSKNLLNQKPKISTIDPISGSHLTPKSHKYNDLKKTISNTINSNETVNDLDQPSPVKVRHRRPLSMYGNPDLNIMSSRESLDIKNFMNELSNEEVVKLSPNHHDKGSRNISSSIDYIKSISRQNTNNSGYGTTSQSSLRATSKSKKRSSITSLKNLLTGGSIKNEPVAEGSSSMRKNSGYAGSKRNPSVEINDTYFSHKNINSSLSDLKEMSPENKKVSHFASDITKTSIKPNISKQLESTIDSSSSHNINRHNSIQSRVKNLFKNSSPPPVKTAQGYGKYTEDGLSTYNNPQSLQQQSLKVNSGPTRASTDIHFNRSTPESMNALTSRSKSVTSSNIGFEEINVGSNYTTKNIHNQGKRKPPPPKPKKPAFLKTDSMTIKDDNPDFEDLDILEKRFKMKFPGVV